MNRTIIEQQGFDLIERMEETSQTIVWKATQRALGRTVVLRILKPEAAARPAIREHFFSIARIVSRIKSESIAAIFDIVSSGDLHYVIMEHVDGPTLDTLVADEGPIAAQRALRIAANLVDGLEQLWDSAKVVHRNLKSATVRLNARGQAKLVDFSLAIPAGPGVNATAMDEGHIVGTPCFLSPEQAQGAHTLTCHSDMYALGAMLYHLVTGIVPFEEQEVVAVLASHVKGHLAPPHTLNPAVPAAFSRFLQRLMMKVPEDRPASWQAVLDDIRRLLAGEKGVETAEGTLPASTIEPFEEPAADAAPQIRLKRSRGKSRFGVYPSKTILDEHAREARRDRALKEFILWLLLALWLLGLLWFRAVYQDDTPVEDRVESAQGAVVENLSEDETPGGEVPGGETPGEAAGAEASAVARGAEHEAVAAPPVAAVESRPAEITPDASPVVAVVEEPPAAAAPGLPQGIPEELIGRLAQALAQGSPRAALQILEQTPERFQERERLLSLLRLVPEPDTLVERYLRSNIGKPLRFEHNNRQRTVIPREVKDGIVRIEANGRGIDLPIESLKSDEKLRWSDRPRQEPERIAYCLLLMRTERRTEVQAYMLSSPLVAPLVIEAARLVGAATEP